MSIARRARHESKVCKPLICCFFRGYPNRAHEPEGEGLSLATQRNRSPTSISQVRLILPSHIFLLLGIFCTMC